MSPIFYEPSPGAAGGGGGAPTTATYVTLSTDATLTNERVLTQGDGITITDAGAGSTVTIALTTATQEVANRHFAMALGGM